MQGGETLEEEIRRQGMLDPSSVWWLWSGSLNSYTLGQCAAPRTTSPHGRASRKGSGPWGMGLLCSFHFT